MIRIDPNLGLREHMLQIVNLARTGDREYLDEELEYDLPMPYTAQEGDLHNPNTIVVVRGIGAFLTGQASLKYRRLHLSQTTTLPARTAFIWNSERELPYQFRNRLARELGLCKIFSDSGEMAVDLQIPGGRIEQGQEALCTLVPAGGEGNLLFTGSRDIHIFAEMGDYDYAKYASNLTPS